jgi:hypothetical protein
MAVPWRMELRMVKMLTLANLTGHQSCLPSGCCHTPCVKKSFTLAHFTMSIVFMLDKFNTFAG